MEALFSANIIDPHHDKKGITKSYSVDSKELLDPSPNSNKRETPETSHDTIAEKRPNADRANRAGLASINRIPCEASVIEKSPDDDGMCTGQMLAHVRHMNRAGKLEQSSTLSWY